MLDNGFVKHLLFIVSFVILLFLLNIFSVLNKRPESVHMWAMCDRACIARNYAEESMNFFQPRVNETKELKGITGLEFPLMNYLAAVCYKIFGFNEFWYRLMMLLTISAGVVSAFSFTGLILKNYLVAGLIVFIWHLTPVLNYYSASFIPDTASLGFILIAWYYFFKWRNTGLKKNIALYFLFGAIACLIKITSLISITVMLILLLIDHFKLLNKNKQRLFAEKQLFVVMSLLIYLFVFAWYKYAAWLSAHNNSGVFLMGTNMVHNQAEFDDTWNGIKNVWIPFYYPKSIYWLMGACIIILIAFIKKVNRMLGLITLGLWAGNICFIYFMFNQFKNHDYYIITLMPALLFLFITTADLLIKITIKNSVRLILLTGSLVLIITQTVFSAKHQKFRYDPNSWLYYGKDLSDYTTIEPFIRQLGIKRTDRVISIADESPNIALYFMNVKGWKMDKNTSDDEILNAIKNGAGYFITNDSTQFKREKLKPFLSEKLGEYYSVQVFKINKKEK